MAQQSHAATFVVRAWWEDDAFRARITYTIDIGCPQTEKTHVVTANIDEVRHHFSAWLLEMTAAR